MARKRTREWWPHAASEQPDKHVLVWWVKVKGHSNEEGNDMVDKLAGYAQKGGAKNEQDIAMVMDGLRAADDWN